MINKKLLLLAFLFNPFLLFAQYGETIRTGRPGQSIGPYTVGSKVFQIQSGISFNEFEDEIDLHTRTLMSNNVFRLGIFEKFEISGVVNYRLDARDRETGTTYSHGVSNIQIGARYNFLEADGAIPGIGIQGRVLLRAQSEEYRREKPGAKFLIVAGNKITDWLSYGTNLGVVWRGNNQGPDGLYTFNLVLAITDRLGTFAEIYGFINNFTTNFDGGFYYLINDDFQLDFSAGWQGNENLDDWFFDTGISYRIDWR